MRDVRELNPKITIQAFADVLRWRLLSMYGGVWADATLYCNRPLSDWLALELRESPIFVFRSGEVALFHSWFIAAGSESLLVSAMAKAMNEFVCQYGGFRHYFELRGLWRIYKLIEWNVGRGNYFIWRSWLFRRVLKAAPYFFQNYLLGFLILTDRECKKEFDAIRIPWGEAPESLQKISSNAQAPSVEAVVRLLDSQCPVQKLTLKRHVREWTEGGILDLLESHVFEA